MRTSESDIVVSKLASLAKPVHDELFLFAYNVYSDHSYFNIVESPAHIHVIVEGHGVVELANNNKNPRLMSVWNDLLDLEVGVRTRIATTIRLMQIQQVFLYPNKFERWLPKNDSSLEGISSCLVKACATVDLELITTENGQTAITFDIESLEILANIIEKLDAETDKT